MGRGRSVRVPSRCPLARVFQDSGKSSILMDNSSHSYRRISYTAVSYHGDSGSVVPLGYGEEATLPRGPDEPVTPLPTADEHTEGHPVAKQPRIGCGRCPF